MLYDPKWDKQVETKVDPFKLETLIAWLETQDPKREYDYANPFYCLLCQYFEAMGFRNVSVAPNYLSHESGESTFPRAFSWDVANGGEWTDTFGAALWRARKAAAR